MEYARRKETEPFAWCIREGRVRVARGDPAAPGHHRVHSYVERGFYASQIECAVDLFGAERLLLLTSDRLRDAPDETVAEICRFLGVSGPSAPLAPRRVRVAADIAYPSVLTSADMDLLRSLYEADVARVAATTGWDLSAWRTCRPSH